MNHYITVQAKRERDGDWEVTKHFHSFDDLATWAAEMEWAVGIAQHAGEDGLFWPHTEYLDRWLGGDERGALQRYLKDNMMEALEEEDDRETPSFVTPPGMTNVGTAEAPHIVHYTPEMVETYIDFIFKHHLPRQMFKCDGYPSLDAVREQWREATQTREGWTRDDALVIAHFGGGAELAECYRHFKFWLNQSPTFQHHRWKEHGDGDPRTAAYIMRAVRTTEKAIATFEAMQRSVGLQERHHYDPSGLRNNPKPTKGAAWMDQWHHWMLAAGRKDDTE